MKSAYQAVTVRLAVLPLAVIMTAMAARAETAPGDSLVVNDTTGKIEVAPDGDTGVRIKFDAVLNPTREPLLSCDLLIGSSGPSAMFVGDLSQYTGIRFKMVGDGTQPAVSLIIRQNRPDGGTRDWLHNGVVVSSTPGEWMIMEIPLVRTDGWTTGRSYNKDSVWDADLADVHAMVLGITPNGLAEQIYGVKDFQLVGEGPDAISEPAQLTGLQFNFGVNSLSEMTDEDFKKDTDRDGMTDYHEILAGLDPLDPNAALRAQVAISAGKNTIAWEGVLGKTYGVLRSNNLMEGFTLLPGASNLKCTFNSAMSYDDESPVAGVPNYYRVVVY